MSKENFLYLIHCEKGIPSSKRFYGGIGWVVVQLCLFVACILSFIAGTGITEVLKDLLYFDLSISATLLGLSTISGIFGGGKQITATSSSDGSSTYTEKNPR